MLGIFQLMYLKMRALHRTLFVLQALHFLKFPLPYSSVVIVCPKVIALYMAWRLIVFALNLRDQLSMH